MVPKGQWSLYLGYSGNKKTLQETKLYEKQCLSDKNALLEMKLC